MNTPFCDTDRTIDDTLNGMSKKKKKVFLIIFKLCFVTREKITYFFLKA